MKGIRNCEDLVRQESSRTPFPSNQQRLRSNDYVNKANLDPFSNHSLIDLPDETQDETVQKAVDGMLSSGLAENFPATRFDDLRKIFMENIGVFIIDFSQSSASITPLD